MKTKFSTLLAFTLLLFIISSCGQSEKGKWSEADKEKFHEELKDLDLGDYNDKKKEWLECYLSKAEANYSSFDEANSDVEGCKKMAAECSEEIFNVGSVKGKWSKDDKDRFFKAISQVDLSALGDLKDAWINCYFEKAQSNYKSFLAADSDEEGCSKLATECQEEIFAEEEDETEIEE